MFESRSATQTRDLLYLFLLALCFPSPRYPAIAGGLTSRYSLYRFKSACSSTRVARYLKSRIYFYVTMRFDIPEMRKRILMVHDSYLIKRHVQHIACWEWFRKSGLEESWDDKSWWWTTIEFNYGLASYYHVAANTRIIITVSIKGRIEI